MDDVEDYNTMDMAEIRARLEDLAVQAREISKHMMVELSEQSASEVDAEVG
ncbi:hypothetical protein GR212_27100 [Rhizobium lusitanum]|uniref:Uncharacterized protein n=1 Tax=Rhizobium lusitanum TaxID=293958 RepID=A0A6L9UGD7_9HYPH|nr:hypothetical protein [Rhizobium lusitanum]NEI73226.1 hypothetical protein [Rhizobium lusitanum]